MKSLSITQRSSSENDLKKLYLISLWALPKAYKRLIICGIVSQRRESITSCLLSIQMDLVGKCEEII